MNPGRQVFLPSVAGAQQRIAAVLTHGHIAPVEPVARELQRVLRAALVGAPVQLYVLGVAEIHNWVEDQRRLDGALQTGQLARTEGEVPPCAEASYTDPGLVDGQAGVVQDGVGESGYVVDPGGEGVQGRFGVVKGDDQHAGALRPHDAKLVIVLRIAERKPTAVNI